MKRLLVVLPLVLVTACGGGDDAPSGLSKAEYISKAEAICDKANKDIEAKPFPTTPAGFPSYVSDVIRIAETATAQLKALEPPSADKDDLDSKVFKALDAQLEEARQYQKDVAAAVAANDQAKLGQLLADAPTKAEADLEWMKKYGFKECVEVAENE